MSQAKRHPGPFSVAPQTSRYPFVARRSLNATRPAPLPPINNERFPRRPTIFPRAAYIPKQSVGTHQQPVHTWPLCSGEALSAALFTRGRHGDLSLIRSARAGRGFPTAADKRSARVADARAP